MSRTNRSGDSFNNVSDAVALFGNSQATLSISSTAAQTAVLEEGLYDVWTDVEVFVKVAADATTGLTTDSGYIIRTGVTLPLWIPSGCKLGARTASSSGTLRYHKVS